MNVDDDVYERVVVIVDKANGRVVMAWFPDHRRREAIADALKRGLSYSQVMDEVGCSSGFVAKVVKINGGVLPRPGKTNPLRLSIEEREGIFLGICQGKSLRQIAKALGRNVSTVSREVKANGGRVVNGMSPFAVTRIMIMSFCTL